MNKQTFDFDEAKLRTLIEHKEQASISFRDLTARLGKARERLARLQTQQFQATNTGNISKKEDAQFLARIQVYDQEVQRLLAAEKSIRDQYEEAISVANRCEAYARDFGWHPDPMRPGSSGPTVIGAS